MFFLDTVTETCKNMGSILTFLHNILTLIQILVPVGLILVGSVDLGRAVLAGKEDEIKAHQKILFRRALAAVAVFFVTTIVTVVMGLIPTSNGVNWSDCWSQKTTS